MVLQSPVLDVVASFFDKQAVLALAALTLLGLLLVKDKKRVIILALVMGVLFTPIIKDYYAIARPCAGNGGCPEKSGAGLFGFHFDSAYGFPSEHATLTAVFAAASWGQWSNFLLVPAALLVSWSRLYLGVHDFDQVAGGMALGTFFLFLSEAIVAFIDRRWPQFGGGKRGQEAALNAQAPTKLSHEVEYGRQLIHILLGLFFVVLGALLDKKTFLIVLATLLNGGFLVSTLKNIGVRIPLLDGFLQRFERAGVLPGRGVVMYATGILLLFSFAPSTTFALGIASILALGDGLATLLGVEGWTKLPWNPRKSFRGTLAFAMGGIAASVWFIGLPAAIFYSILLAIAESIEWGLDDNILVPAVGIVLGVIFKL